MTDTPTPDMTAPLTAIERLQLCIEQGLSEPDLADLWGEVEALSAKLEAVRAERDAVLASLTALQSDEWSDKPDNLTPSIAADFGSDGFYDRYAQAIELVSNRHSKGALVSLVAFLLAARQKGGEG